MDLLLAFALGSQAGSTRSRHRMADQRPGEAHYGE
jgi:hypothetical protein